MLRQVAVEVGGVEGGGDVGQVQFVEGRLGEHLQQLALLGVEDQLDFML